jgi:hypothetical protein
MNQSLNKILDKLTDEYWDNLKKEEEIEKSDLEFVMLEIEYSPVQMDKDSRPVEIVAHETRGGNWIIEGYPFNPVSTETLKLWRYRYLKNRTNPFAHLFQK